jgi:hypothetical protein
MLSLGKGFLAVISKHKWPKIKLDFFKIQHICAANDTEMMKT